MNVTMSWLGDWVDLPGSPEELARLLAMRGFPVKSLEKGIAFDAGIVVGRVLEAAKHPNADRLRLCRVDVGGEPLSIVCGAPNVAAGQLVAVAVVGSRLPGGTKLHRTKIRGVESEGMICSERELGLCDESEGIWLLPGEPPIGAPIASVIPARDTLLDVEVTSNRTDCMCVRGLAREIASARGAALKDPAPLAAASGGALPRVTIENSADCYRYMARVVRGVTVGPSPEWLRRRIELVGHRSINNVVDATNYVLHEYGQPIHAFDASKVGGCTIRVRRARAGERLVILDGRDVALHTGVLVIADPEKPIALAGIMGGLESGVTERTTEVILESAHFDAAVTRDGARSLEVDTDASARFTQGVDPNAVALAIDATARILSEAAGGSVVRERVDQWPAPPHPIQVALSTVRTNRLLGTELGEDAIEGALRSLGIEPAGPWRAEAQDRITTFRIPPYRHDLAIEEDLVEEVARVVGYDAIPVRVAAAPSATASIRGEETVGRQFRDVACGLGYHEGITTCLVGPIPEEARGGIDAEEIWELKNPKSREIKHMRTGLLPGLLAAAARNVHRGVGDVRLVEVGKAFRAAPGPIGSERFEAALVLTGSVVPWSMAREEEDRYLELRGVVEAILEAFGIDSLSADSYHDPCFKRGTGATIGVSGQSLGRIGEISPEFAAWASLPWRAWGAVIDIGTLASRVDPARRYRGLSRFPAVKRDLAILVDRDVRHADVVSVIREGGAPLLDVVRLFDLYEGKSVPAGSKSMAFALEFRAPDRTLSDPEIDGRVEAILGALKTQLGAVQRGAESPAERATKRATRG